MKNENFITIQGRMVNDLKLKGNELLVYSIIYGFSQDGNNWFNWSLQYLSEWANSTKQWILKNLQSLVQKWFIEKKEVINNWVKFCEYKAKIHKNDDFLKEGNHEEERIPHCLWQGLRTGSGRWILLYHWLRQLNGRLALFP